MRILLILLILAFGLQKGTLMFIEVGSPSEINGTFLLYIYQPFCRECEILEGEVFSQWATSEMLRGLNLYALDLSKSPIRSIRVHLGGQVVYVDHGKVTYLVQRGERNFLIPGTPTVIIGRAGNGTIELLGFWTGTPERQDVSLKELFTRFVEMSLRKGSTSLGDNRVIVNPVLGVMFGFAMGVIGTFSPCILPVLSLIGASYLAKRNMARIISGLVLSFALFGIAVAAVGTLTVMVETYIRVIGGIALILLSLPLFVKKLGLSLATLTSRVQTGAVKRLGKFGDFFLGASLGVTWLPCIVPYFGFATVVAITSLSGDYTALFLTMLSYGLGTALMVYILVKGIIKVGTRLISTNKTWRIIEKAAGLAVMSVGLYLILTALA